jgi:hypothetical protein
MPYLTEADLLPFRGKTIAKALRESAQTTIFLSHSHHDKSFIEEASKLLASLGASVYVDYEDTEMPTIISPETAERIKDRIGSCKKFIMLASNNALQSRWVPWELGYADAVLKIKNVAIFPFERNFETWQGSEYVGIYSTIKKSAEGAWGIYPSNYHSGYYLSDWLKY